MTPEALATTVSATLEEAREAGKAQNATYVVGNLLQNLDKLYPEAGMLTDFQDHGEWVFNNAGGAMGSMYIVHASITE
jgi:C-8 sterol isomerase